MINLWSDTQTRPTAAMRQAIAGAEVGDEQRGEDPTTRALEERVAELLGHEAAVFLPSGTMANEIAVRLHIRPGGDEVILHRDNHLVRFEGGAPSDLSGAVLHPIDGVGGMLTADDVRGALRRPGDRYAPRSRLLCVEQTANVAGGRIWPRERILEVLGIATEAGLRTHLDGARLLNATVATGEDPADVAGLFDTAWIDFTKGLGAPVGAALAGSQDLITEAWRFKQGWGGAMRQSGIIAAGALHALDHHVERLADDHDNARRLAEGLAALPGVEIELETVETNIIVFDVPDAASWIAAAGEAGVLFGPPLSKTTVRGVTHLDVDAADVEAALSALAAVSRG